jgi:hypothetical protein
MVYAFETNEALQGFQDLGLKQLQATEWSGCKCAQCKVTQITETLNEINLQKLTKY